MILHHQSRPFPTLRWCSRGLPPSLDPRQKGSPRSIVGCTYSRSVRQVSVGGVAPSHHGNRLLPPMEAHYSQSFGSGVESRHTARRSGATVGGSQLAGDSLRHEAAAKMAGVPHGDVGSNPTMPRKSSALPAESLFSRSMAARRTDPLCQVQGHGYARAGECTPLPGAIHKE